MQSQDPMDNIRSAMEHADKNPSKVVSYSWYLVLVSERRYLRGFASLFRVGGES